MRVGVAIGALLTIILSASVDSSFLVENKSDYILHDATIFLNNAYCDVGDIRPKDCFTFNARSRGPIRLGFYLVQENDSVYYCTAPNRIGDIIISNKTMIFEAEILE